MRMRVSDLHRWLTQRTGHGLGADEGVMFGDLDRPVTCAAVCWMPSAKNIERAVALGADLLIAHEAVVHPYPRAGQSSDEAPDWPINRVRREILETNRLTLTRLHGTLDELYIYDDFAEQLGLKPTHLVARGEGYADRIYRIPPTPFGELVERTKRATGLSQLRCSASDPQQPVETIGLPWGGLGLFVNVGYVQGLLDLAKASGLKIDLLIAGETDNYGMRFATEQGVSMIESSHEVSETRGLARFTDEMAKQFPQLTAHWLDEPCVWQAR